MSQDKENKYDFWKEVEEYKTHIRLAHGGLAESKVDYLASLCKKGLMDIDLLELLMFSDFVLTPASTTHHGNYEGGLFDHCVAMYNWLVKATEGLGIVWERKESIGNIAFGHDYCKCDSYKKVHDSFIGGHETYHYEWNPKSVLHGHGMKSVILLQQHMSLTEEEMYCILYHMGAYETDQWEAFDKAIKKYPNVLYTHTADMYASKVEGV